MFAPIQSVMVFFRDVDKLSQLPVGPEFDTPEGNTFLMSSFNFTVDKKSVREGDYVVVSWACKNPDAVSLTVDNGYGQTSVQLADSGSRSVVMDRSKGKTVLRLSVVQNGKIHKEELSVKVEARKAPKAERTSTHSGPKNSFKNIKGNWSTFVYRLRYGWQMLPEKKRRIYRAILYALIAVWIFSIAESIGYRAGFRKGVESAPQEMTQNA